MKDEPTTGADINKRVQKNTQDMMMGMANSLLKDMGIKMPAIPFCYIHKEQFAGPFVEYLTMDRETVHVCMGCVNKALDKLLGVIS